MNSYIHDALIDIERQLQTALDDLRIIKEQVCCPWDETMDTVTMAEIEQERQESFESLCSEQSVRSNNRCIAISIGGEKRYV